MSKLHDENKDLRLVSKKAKIDYSNKTISAPKSALIGNKTWGRIDYLTKYCGWFFIWNNDVHVFNKPTSDNDDIKKKRREIKKAAKQNTLTDKRKRR